MASTQAHSLKATTVYILRHARFNRVGQDRGIEQRKRQAGQLRKWRESKGREFARDIWSRI